MAAQDNNVMQGLIGKIYNAITAPNTVMADPVARVSVDNRVPPFISFCSPGIAIDTLNFGNLLTADEVNACSDFSQLINSVPAPNVLWQPTNKKIWEIYELALTDIKLPLSDLSDQERAVLQRAEAFLREEVTVTDPFTQEVKKEVRPTGAYQAYESLYAAYASVIKAYNTARITAISDPTPANVSNWVDNGALLEINIRNAYSRWGSLGYRDYVTRANGIISAMMARGPEAYYERLRSNFQLGQKKDFRGTNFWPTFAYPARILEPSFNDGWSAFTFTQNEVHQYQSSSSVSVGGGGGVSFGLWSFGASSSYSSQRSYASCDTSNLSISVELIQVPLQRPWMTTWIFSSRGWKGGSTMGGDGSICSGGSPLSGLMPLLPTSMILARNLRVNLDMTSEVNRAAASQFSARASVGWGPWSVRGNYSRSSSSSSHDFVQTGSGITCRGTQIIGFVCEVLPRSPNHDPALNWGSERRHELLKGDERDDFHWLEAAPFLRR